MQQEPGRPFWFVTHFFSISMERLRNKDFSAQAVEVRESLLDVQARFRSDEQSTRFKHRKQTGWKRNKITPEDCRNRLKSVAYQAAFYDMIQHTSTELAPWHLIEANNTLFTRINVLSISCDRLQQQIDR
jgi:polyphosphate kinase 2 (PPK2 family)